MKRKEWYSELNLAVAKVFVAHNVNKMLLADVKNQLMLHDDIQHLNECYWKMMGKTDWSFYSHDDRFVNNLKNVADFEIVKIEVEGRMRRVVVKK